ncbi:MAG: multifunctional oxoglutarate decarboxylase/oxoglutarate dehydrogenase thiamine pyrophosphate-binding subunit/dihydrolipoyllysine-residue succinyltransferase subunit, partial [Pseudonocardiales bacterium]
MSRSDPPVQFGPNEWLVEEMYEQFLANPSAVDSSWHDFFADYRPPSHSDINGKASRTSTLAPAKQPPRRQSPANGATATAHAAGPAQAQHGSHHDTTTPLRGAAARVVANMETSLELPTATSVRAVPAKLLVDNRIVINNHLQRTRGGKISFTHLIGYATVRALAEHPQM